MNAPSVDIKNLLDGESALGLVFATNLFIGIEPATPDNCVTIYDTPGREPVMTLSGKDESSYYYPFIQIRVRDNNYIHGWSIIEDIKNYLHGIHGMIQEESVYDLIRCVQEPALLDWDNQHRVRFIATFSISRKEARDQS